MMRVDDIPKELKVGQIYSEKEILGYILNNDVYVLCEDEAYLTENENRNFEVFEISEMYLHYSQPRWTYNIPNQKKQIIKIKFHSWQAK